MKQNGNMTCSFCGKSNSSVKKLIASPDGSAFICSDCIEVCKEIIKDENVTKIEKELVLPSPKEIKAKLEAEGKNRHEIQDALMHYELQPKYKALNERAGIGYE